MRLRKPNSKIDFFHIGLSLLAFWYAHFSIERNAIGLRGSTSNRFEEQGLFWLSVLFVIGFGIYLLYLVLTPSED